MKMWMWSKNYNKTIRTNNEPKQRLHIRGIFFTYLFDELRENKSKLFPSIKNV